MHAERERQRERERERDYQFVTLFIGETTGSELLVSLGLDSLLRGNAFDGCRRRPVKASFWY